MVRQTRSAATRQRILNAAADVFSTTAFAAATLGDIVDRSELTKQAFHDHFDSKEAVASAIMEQSSATLLGGFRAAHQPSSPALVNTINGMVVVAEIVASDKLARAGAQLTRNLDDSNRVASRIQDAWGQEITGLARQASCEGDLRRDLEPEVVAQLILFTMLGALTGIASSHVDEQQRLRHTCEFLLSAVTSEESLPYYQEFVAGKALHALQPTPVAE